MAHLVGRILVPTEKTKTIKAGKHQDHRDQALPRLRLRRDEARARRPHPPGRLLPHQGDDGRRRLRRHRRAPDRDEGARDREDARRLRKPEDQPTVKLVFEKGEHVTIKEGPFQGYEGTVDELLPDKGLVRVLVTIFGRQAPIELEEWQIGKSDET
jgi:transcriptional antiterminator NusG